MIGVLVGEKIEMIIDDEGRVNLGSFLRAPKFADLETIAGFFYREHLGPTIISAGDEKAVFTELDGDGNWNSIFVELARPESFPGFRIKAVEATFISSGEEDDLLYSSEVCDDR